MNEKLKEYKQFKDLEPNKYFQLGNVTLKTVEHEKRKDNLRTELNIQSLMKIFQLLIG